MVYKPRIEIIGKKIKKNILHFENKKGIQATKFDKWDMFYAFVDSEIDMKMKEWCKEYMDEITKNKKLPKGIDDVIDAIWLCEIMKKSGV